MVTDAQLKVLFKYWEKHGGPNYYSANKVFPMFGIEENSDNVREIFMSYYGGQDEWKRQIKDFEGKILRPIENHYFTDLEYKVTDMSIYMHGPYHRYSIKLPYVHVSAVVSPYTKLNWEGKEILLNDTVDLDVFDFLKKYFPEVKEKTETYDELKYRFNLHFIDGDEDWYGELNSTISNDLETRITKPYALQIDAVDVDSGKKSDFEPTINESMFRIKQLINFSDY